jgi:hypothetical protein
LLRPVEDGAHQGLALAEVAVNIFNEPVKG